MPQPVDEWFCQAIEDWIWNKHTEVMANRIAITMKSFDHGISFVCESNWYSHVIISYLPTR